MTELLLFIAGLAALVAGAEVLVRSASQLALKAGLSPLVVGLTVVAFGTSAPEIAVSVDAAMSGQPELAVGNVLGSNIANILLILGLSALVAPLAVGDQVIRQEIPLLIAVTLLTTLLAMNGRLSIPECAVLFSLLIAYITFLVRQSRRMSKAVQGELSERAQPTGWQAHPVALLGMILAGLAMLVLGAEWLVGAAVTFARALGVSDLVIGLTVVAIGTSLPEIATSLMAALKGERDLAVGNVVGSNVFNLLGCLGLAGLATGQGLPIPEAAVGVDLWVVLAVTVATLPVCLVGRDIARWEGAVFLAYYVAYTLYLILRAQAHDWLPTFTTAMLGFVIPMTLLTLLVSLVRHRRRYHH